MSENGETSLKFSAAALEEEILRRLPYQPLPQQSELIRGLAEYAGSHGPREVVVLNGYAGSGKTSIMGAFVRAMARFRRKTVTLAPTGRAAKVAADFSGGKASTIHRHIFRADSPEPGAKFQLAPNRSRDTIFIIDEASLIADSRGGDPGLLRQLARYVFSGRDCGMILLGDKAQLPPVGQERGSALDVERLKALGLSPLPYQLDVAVRQQAGSGILTNATVARQILYDRTHPRPGYPPPPPLRLRIAGFTDVRIVTGYDLLDELSTSWSTVGMDETLIITRSNKRANDFNNAVRSRVMMAEEPLQQGDRLVISRNDYYWSQINGLKTLIANGDTAIVEWVGRREKMYGRYFVDVELSLGSEADDTRSIRVGAKLMLRSLISEGPSVPQQEMEDFYARVLREQEAAHEDGPMTEGIMAALTDPYYNALHAKYGYCVTCHKAQGGQWKHVYVDMTGIDIDNADDSFYRWFYTACTRATSKLFFINPACRNDDAAEG